MLTYTKYTGRNKINDSIQIAKDTLPNGMEKKIYYNPEPLDVLKDIPDPINTVSHLTDDAVQELGLSHVSTAALNNLDNDIVAGEMPTNRVLKRVAHVVKQRLDSASSKIYNPEHANISLIPRNIHNQTERLFVSGSSGSGKSYFAGEYARNYQIEHPGNNVILLTPKAFDKAFDNVDNIVKPEINRQFIQYLGTANVLQDFRHCLIIFDDFEGIPDRTMKKAIIDFKDNCLKMGRAHNINIVTIQHKTLGGKDSLVDHCECNIYVFFPNQNPRECKNLLKLYLGFEKSEASTLLRDLTGERWACIIKPNILITQHFIKII